MSRRELTCWRVFQAAIWAVGMFIWGALIWKPELGLHLLWNVLIPLAPALLVIAPGVWRNVCPLASLSMAPHHFGLSKNKRMSREWRGRLYLVAFLLLIVVVPLRKVLLDSNGPILAAVLCAVGLLAIGLGVVFQGRSGWCSSLCPVYPVELLYGSQPLVTVPNAHCETCAKCVTPCSDSITGLSPRTAIHTRLARSVGIVLTGCFPGFIFGWYQVSTYTGWEGFRNLGVAYGTPFSAGIVTLSIYLLLRILWPRRERTISHVFAAAAVMTYYWFRLPPIFGIGNHDAAMIVDVSASWPSWSAAALRGLEIVAFSWVFFGRASPRRAWEAAPPPAEDTKAMLHHSRVGAGKGVTA